MAGMPARRAKAELEAINKGLIPPPAPPPPRPDPVEAAKISDDPLSREEAVRLLSRTARALAGTRDCLGAVELCLDLQGAGVKAVPLAPVAPILPDTVIDGASGVMDRLTRGGGGA